MNNSLKVYRSILKENNFKEYSYQKEFLTNGKFLLSKKPFVLAMGTSAGKTITTIMFLEMFYQNNRNKKKKTLIIPSSLTILRDNFQNVLSKFNPTFKYSVVSNSKELKKSLKEDFDVLVCLPLTLKHSIKALPKFDIFILDEAHQWYFKETINSILNKIKPKHQLLLCGTPSKFISKGNEFNFQFVPIMELYEEGIVTNAKIEIISTNYFTLNSDFESIYGNLKTKKLFSIKESREALEYVCNQMLTKIKKRIKNKIDVFIYLPKTIFFCHSIKQSKDFYNILRKNINTKDRVLISNQTDDIDSVNFQRFKSDKKIKILICVNRGRMGFNMNQLFNIVDFTLTKNIDLMLQQFGRLLRLSKYKLEDKIYYKVTPTNDVYFYENIMNAMLCLTQYEWYTKYNGYNMEGIRIPKIRNNYTKLNNSKHNSSSSNENKEFDKKKFGIPIDLNFFKKFEQINSKSNFKTYSFTTLKDVRKTLNSKSIQSFSMKELTKIAKLYKNRSDFSTHSKKAYKYAKSINVIEDICKHMKPFNKYTYESLKDLSKKYTSYKIFTAENKNAFAAMRRLGYKDELTSHMKKKNYRLTLSDVKNIAEKCKTIGDFAKQTSAYGWAKRNGYFERLTKHMKRHIEPKKFNKTIVLKLVKQCVGRRDFNDRFSSASKWLKKNNLYEEMMNVIPPINELKNNTIIDFSKNYYSIDEIKIKRPMIYKLIIRRNLLPKLKFKK